MHQITALAPGEPAIGVGLDLIGYQLIEPLYRGARTAVYRAVRLADRHPVVLKFLQRETPSFSELLQFRNQYTLTRSLHHPSIIQTYDLVAHGNRDVLVMEDYGGISLRNYAKDRALPPAQVLAIGLQLTDILHHLYQNRIIHKDLKPANILIHPDSQQIKLIDFSIASVLPREIQETKPLNGLEGTLPYLSPEQTGRMNRGIDYRSDFYSLGVTLFELLTGQLPFSAADPMEWVHCHLAKQPPLAHTIAPTIAPALSEIVAKLLAKNAEDRYQSALGLKHDLTLCQQQLQATGRIEAFPIAQADICDRFVIPERLYGRTAEVQALLAAFDRVAQGHPELMLVAGFSGIGKTAVVNEVHKPIVRQRGYFIQGKYDQFQRNIPLSAFVQAFRGLMEQLLAESDDQVTRWKTRILDVLGENGQVLIDVIPELAQIIGPQPTPPALSGTAAQNRFNQLFQQFVQVFTGQEHPLVLFLDDLQWADSASLNLLQLLMQDAGHLLILGAYRDNEVFPAHPFRLTVDSMTRAGATVQTITLPPLSPSDLNQLVADTLSCDRALATPLTDLVYRKTQGNPFFTTQFLKALHQDGLITFNQAQGHWQCDITQIRSQALTEDVVEFMAAQLQKLPASTQDSLRLAACIGAQFDLHTLAIVCEKTPVEVATDLWKAIQEGFILPVSETYKFFQSPDRSAPTHPSVSVAYKFLHDRIQQAAYSLIPQSQKEATHYQIGHLLLNHLAPAQQDEQLFEIVSHLNRGSRFIDRAEDRRSLIQLNLLAGRKAKASTAYAAALTYFSQGIELLPSDAWTQDYPLNLALHTELAEAAYLSTDFEQMEQWATIVLQQAQTLLDTIPVQQTQLMGAKAQGQILKALDIGLQVLESLGTTFPDQPSPADVEPAFGATRALWQHRDPLSLVDLPSMSDPDRLAAMQILSWLVSCAYMANPSLMALLIFKQVELSLQHGNCPVSIYSYADYGLILCGVIGDIPAGYAFGQLALKLLDRLQAMPFKSRGWYVVYTYIQPWKSPLQASLLPLQEAYQTGLDTGDVEIAGLAAAAYCYYAYHAGQELTGLTREIEAYLASVSHLKQTTPQHYLEIYQQTILNLLGQTETPDRLEGRVFSQETSLPLLEATNHRTALFYLHFNQTVLSYLLGESQSAAQASLRAESYLDGGTGTFMIPLYAFYDALVQLSLYRDSTLCKTAQQDLLARVALHQSKLQDWATHAPSNHQHRWKLIAAERSRVLGHKGDAIDHYDRAIALAQEHGFIQDAALANELAAQFYLEWGREKLAQDYLTQAYYGYARWGATAKVLDLERRYPQLLESILPSRQSPMNLNETIVGSQQMTLTTTADSSVSLGQSLTSTIDGKATPCKSPTSRTQNISTALDLATILKASQTLSSEIELDKLLTKLLQLVIANAGADKCAFIQVVEDQLLLEAITEIDGMGESVSILHHTALQDYPHVPIGLIRSVKRTLTPALILNATLHPSLATDPYIAHQQPQSILCTPIVHQGKLIGLLYLENRSVTGAFTDDRIEILNLLCAQAAISLENARLYQATQQAFQELQQKEAQYRSIFEAVSDGLAITDLDTGRLITANPAYCQLHGYDYAAILQLHPLDFIPVDRQAKFTAFLNAVKSGQEFLNEAVCKNTDGSPFHVEIRSVPFDYDGKRCGLSVIRDVTERRQMELAIQEKNRSLEQTLTELQQAQMQLVQSEKMSALGNLVAGVAHEINNPVGFLKGNIQPALNYVQDLFGLIALYQEHYPNPKPVIQEEIATIDLEFIQEDLPKLIGSMQDGIDRIRNISTSLRTFSRADSDVPTAFNLHEGLDSTLLILKHRLKANEHRPEIQVMTQYGSVPEIECFAGQLNQVFMNLLANAIDALEDSNQGRSFADIQANPNCITIVTSMEDANHVKIQIQDNGVGIPETVQDRIFDHLFTTKAVGKGTGLGLAIAQQIIVEKHHGTITVHSGLGAGTEFTIVLPINAV